MKKPIRRFLKKIGPFDFGFTFQKPTKLNQEIKPKKPKLYITKLNKSFFNSRSESFFY